MHAVVARRSDDTKEIKVKKGIWVVVAAVFGIAIAVVLIPSADTVDVDRKAIEGKAATTDEAPTFEIVEPEVEQEVEKVPSGPTATINTGPERETDGKNITEKFDVEHFAGPPLDRHAQIDGRKWMGVWRMLKKNDVDPKLARRARNIADEVLVVTNENDAATYSELFAAERALIADIRGATTDEQLLETIADIEMAVDAVEQGDDHPRDVERIAAEQGAAEQ